jgi:hypothetical protein
MVVPSVPAKTTLTYRLDTSTPAPIVALTAGERSPSNQTSPRFAIADTETPDGPDTFVCDWVGPDHAVISNTTCSAGEAFPTAGHGQGTYTLTVTARDLAGNTASTVIKYTLDTVAPLAPVIHLSSAKRSSSRTPLWIWSYAPTDPDTVGDVATCTVVSSTTWVLPTRRCGPRYQPTLGGPDGRYYLIVTLTDPAGNATSAVSSAYVLDSKAPAGPQVYLEQPSSGVGHDRHPTWVVEGPPNTTLLCTLVRTGHGGAVVSPESTCPDPTTYSLVGLPDGRYVLRVVAVDQAGNRSFAATWPYILAPDPPLVRAPNGQNLHARWTVSGNPNDTFVCTLLDGSRVIASAHVCSDHPTYDMSGLPIGTYTLSVIQIGAEGSRSEPGSASWLWRGIASHPGPGSGPGPRRTTGGGGPPKGHRPPPPSAPGLPKRVAGAVKHQLQRIGHGVRSIPVYPYPHPGRIGDDVVHAVQGVVQAVGSAGGGTGFPLLLVATVLVFLIAQNRIDRRDPKLALASVAADDLVEFQPPPSRQERS